MGIRVRKRWIAAKDSRTRHDHGMADGQIVPHDEPFEVGGFKLMFPGDRAGGAPGRLIYNCRCTMATVEKDGIEAEPRQMRVRNPATGRNELISEMTFEEWTEWRKALEKAAESDIINTEVRAGSIQLSLNQGAQNKHIRGSKWYIPGRSYIFGTVEDAEELVRRYSGTGELRMTRDGQWTKKEFVTADRLIGVSVDPQTGKETETNRFSIHYGKKGTHIVPAAPIKE